MFSRQRCFRTLSHCIKVSAVVIQNKMHDNINTLNTNNNRNSTYSAIFKFIFFNSVDNFEDQHKFNRYWQDKSIPEMIQEADNLYKTGNYLEVYEYLKRLQYQNNVEIQWRICRSLYKLASVQNISRKIRNNVLTEAFNIIEEALEENYNHPEVHKWMAIVLDAKSGNESILAKIKTASTVKEHMLKCLELNPNDVTVLYMLGYWCYEITKLSWLQKRVTKILVKEPLLATYDEAYKYFEKVEQLQPRTFICNSYMLGKCCYEMGMLYRASYYLRIATELPIKNQDQQMKVEDAKLLIEKLKDYDVSSEALRWSE